MCFIPNLALAKETTEISVNEIFTQIDNIKNNNYDNYDLLVDYSVQILNNYPNTLESYYTLNILSELESSNKLNQKVANFKNLYFQDIDDINKNTIEKMVLLSLLASGFGTDSDENCIEQQKSTINWLNNVKNNCLNPDYAALATVLLFYTKDLGYENALYFKEKYPVHSFIPLVCTDIIAEYSIKKDYTTAISEIIKLIDKYGEIITPYNCKLKYEYYAIIAVNYMLLNDKINAEKYIKIIETEDPKFHSLKKLENELNEQ